MSYVVRIIALTCLLVSTTFASNPRVLIVTAHPDDESGMAATVFKITKELGGVVDLCVITNGEAGFKYSLLAEDIYDKQLTSEAIGREHLPGIRKKELMAGGHWIGIRNYFFLDQLDTYYTLDADTVLSMVWDTAMVTRRIREITSKNGYTHYFCLLPTPETHGHHKAATILALKAALDLPASSRPAVLGVSVDSVSKPSTFRGLGSYPITAITKKLETFDIDRRKKFGFNNRLDYRIVVNWLIAEHKSQGTMQTLMGQGNVERFHWFDINGVGEGYVETTELFRRLFLLAPGVRR